MHDRHHTTVEGEPQVVGGEKYCGYIGVLYEVIHSNLERFDIRCEEQSVELIKGLIQGTVRLEEPIALASVDVD